MPVPRQDAPKRAYFARDARAHPSAGIASRIRDDRDRNRNAEPRFHPNKRHDSPPRDNPRAWGRYAPPYRDEMDTDNRIRSNEDTRRFTHRPYDRKRPHSSPLRDSTQDTRSNDRSRWHSRSDAAPGRVLPRKQAYRNDRPRQDPRRAMPDQTSAALRHPAPTEPSWPSDERSSTHWKRRMPLPPQQEVREAGRSDTGFRPNTQTSPRSGLAQDSAPHSTGLVVRGAAASAQASSSATHTQLPPPGPPPGPPPRQSEKASMPTPSCSGIVPFTAEKDEAYQIVDQVGEGTYGQVYKAAGERSGALVALKKIRMEAIKEGFPVTSMREIKLLQSLRHENVIRLQEIMTSRAGSVYMVFEYMEHDLNGILVHPEVSFTDAHRKSLASQLLQGLSYLHHRSVLHRDLKGSNLLLNNAGTLKIADFGLARTYYKRHHGDYTNRVVTLWYRPPELLLGATQYGPEVDTWGAGCLFLELFTRHAIFQGHDEIHQLQMITQVLGPITKESWVNVEGLPWFELMRMQQDFSSLPSDTPNAWKIATEHLTPAAKELAQGLLQYDPTQRWTAKKALASAYFTTEEPFPEPPAEILAALRGEWHEMQAKHARKKARQKPTEKSRDAEEIRTGA
ncbi:[pyruvate dehydrogenase (acetyl-transferring)] kinase [Malassezia yamatoensis]|uniref:cyclin-dependent kinase n=1 Tax=Malassezia yamatoensis TaxID=253288 RepID=A0AAJ6CJ94_9BASI|nr:[pyruvate dehydrogenase (acetyl-transferring)] kinase [Malassezia yamatoensis]